MQTRLRTFAPDEPLHKRLRSMAEANLNANAMSISASQQSMPQPQMSQRTITVPPMPPGAPRMVLVNPDDDGQDEKYLYGAWKNRLTLALTSSLPNEVDWAFSKLVKLSYTRNFFVGVLPGMLEAMLDHAAPLFNELFIKKTKGVLETCAPDGITNIPAFKDINIFYDAKHYALVERVLQVLHVLRNLSFWPDNAMLFCKNYELQTLLAKGIALPTSTYYVEIKHHSLDILDNIAPYLLLQGPNDYFLAVLHQCIFEDDRGFIMDSTRTLIRFYASETNAKILRQVDYTKVVRRYLQLLLVPDEELVNTVLDWFYEFSSLGVDASSVVTGAVKFNVLKLFIKFLSWQGFQRRSAAPAYGVSGAAKAAPSKTIPSKPAVPTSEAAKPSLQSTDSASFSCCWGQAAADGTACTSLCMTVEGLFEHIQKEHITKGQSHYSCEWKGCKWGKASQAEASDSNVHRVHALKHVLTHLSGLDESRATTPASKPHIVSSGEPFPITSWPASAQSQTYPTSQSQPHLYNPYLQQRNPLANDDDLKGIPLTAMLVLRNLARVPQNKSLFAPFEESLAQKMISDRRFAKGLASVLAEVAKA
ncbi:hypothetical protein DFS34DRAFT_681575 [Phlyctochytrium arcticum]|nr:hypothetical protein DFS34DRAFT_681575 [Phlyctochytrium arcticum]